MSKNLVCLFTSFLIGFEAGMFVGSIHIPFAPLMALLIAEVLVYKFYKFLED